MDYLLQIAGGVWHTLTEMAPFLLFGFLLAGVLSVFISGETVRRHLGKGRFLPSIKASLFGIPLPLCSCGVIPVAASLRRHGASRGATTAFLLSTPQTGVDSIFVTYSLLGLTFALFTPFAALASGLTAGLMVSLLIRNGDEGGHPAEPDKDCCCEGEGKKPGVLHRVFRHGFVVLARDIAHPLFLGLLIAGAIHAFVPADYFVGQGGDGMSAKLVMLLAGVPLYVCATASVPIAASLIVAGLSPGAALVFLMSGPATNAATITTIWKLMGRATAIIYLISVAVSALLAGTLLDKVFVVSGTEAVPSGHDMLPEPARVACAILLVFILLWARYGQVLKRVMGDRGQGE